MCEAGDLCVLSICVFFSACLPVFSHLSLWAENVLWCLPTISDPFLRFMTNFSPSSLCRFNPSIILSLFSLHWKLNCLLFTGRYRWSAHTPSLCFMLVLTGFNLVLIFPLFFQYLCSCSSLLGFHVTFFCLYLLPSCSPVLLANPSNRCGSLCGTNRPEAEGCLRPFSLITSHLCVHKQTNTAINLRAQCRLRGRGWGRKSEIWIQTEGEFCVIYSRPGSRSGHLPCSVIATSLEGHWSCAPRTWIGFCN